MAAEPRNLSHIEKGLETFFKSSTSKVLAIKGPWGVGKTHFWKAYIERQKKAPRGLEQYAYVSLFGASSVRDIYNAIITKTAKPWEGKSGRLASALSWDRVKKILPVLRHAEIPYLGGTQLLADFAIEKLIRKHLICFDDLERKGDLTATSFLGMIAELTEQKESKVILIYNDQEVRDGSLSEAIASARDKLLDMELSFCPSVHENMGLIKAPLFEEYGLDCCARLDVANVRIMLRAEEIIAYFRDKYAQSRRRFEKTLLRRVALLTVVHYVFAKEFSLSEFAKNDLSSSFGAKEDEVVEPLIKKCREASERLEYIAAKWEMPIVQYLEGGVIDEELAKKLFDEAETMHVDQDLNGQQRKIWRLYHSTFAGTQAEFVAAHLSFLEKHCEDVALNNVTAAVDVLVRMGADAQLLNRFLERAINAAASKVSDEEIEEFRRRGVRAEVIEKIVVIRAASKPTETLAELAKRIGNEGGFHPPDIALLSRFSAEDFIRWWRTDTEQDTVRLTKNLLGRCGAFTAYHGPEVLSTINAALDQVRMESEIDRIRVDNFVRDSKMK